jgi:Tfp pilus assembly PilM family ATPase/Tfp pilus assembly protein PilN
MSSLGIYFGPQVITIVETKGKRVLNDIRIPRSTLSGGELEEKIPEEANLVNLLKDELSRNKITSREVNLGFSGKDVIIRTFDLPVMPQNELYKAVNFEVRKYIPFKVEELISDFQANLDKSSQKNLILFMGIKKVTLDKYLSIFNQLNLKVSALEYSAFSILRFIKLGGLSDKGVVAVISADLQEEDEVNVTVLEDGFPLFSRDITLAAGPEEFAKPEETGSAATNLDKLKSEIRLSLDYYQRKLSHKSVKNVFFINSQAYRLELETFIKERGLAVHFIDVSRYIGKPITLSLSLIKGYAASLSKVIRTSLKIDLLAARAKTKLPPKAGVALPIGVALLLARLKVSPRVVGLGIVICAAAFAIGLSKMRPLEKEIKEIIALRPKVANVNPEASYEELNAIDKKYNEKVKTLDKLVRERLYATKVLDLIPRLIPENVWLTDFYFRGETEEGKGRLTLRGIAYMVDSDTERKLISTFLSNLKADPQFSKYFKQISLGPIDHTQIQGKAITNFVITCRN